jgi:hypothetical protein
MFATGRYQNHNQFLTREAQATYLGERYRGQDLLDHQLTRPFDAIEISHQPYPYGAAFQPPSGGYEANPYTDNDLFTKQSDGGNAEQPTPMNLLWVLLGAGVVYYLLVPR